MASNVGNIAKTGLVRLFYVPGTPSPANPPQFLACAVLGGISQDLGSSDPIVCPDPAAYGRFKTVATTQSPAGAVESSMTAKWSLDERSDLAKLAKSGTTITLIAHTGLEGADPRVYNTFKKSVFLENCRINSYALSDLGSMEEDTGIDETYDVTADDFQEFVDVTISERASSTINNPIIGVAGHYRGETGLNLDNRFMMFAVTDDSEGSPASSADLLYSLDSGSNWTAAGIDTMATADQPKGIAVVGDKVVIADQTSNSLHYVAISDMDGVTALSFTEVTTGFVSSKTPTCISSFGNRAFIGAAGGYVYQVEDPSSGVTSVHDGDASVNAVASIHALTEDIVLVGLGNSSNELLFSSDGSTFSLVDGPLASANITAVAALSELLWIVGTGTGRMFYTVNAGKSWVEKSFPGSGSGAVASIKFATNLVGYASHTLSSRAYLLRTTDGGYSWTRLTIPAIDQIADLAVFPQDATFIIAGGTADDGTDGSLLVGKD